jgi:hypothetical protein
MSTLSLTNKMAILCSYCDREFTKNFNRIRHEKLMHEKQVDEEMDESPVEESDDGEESDGGVSPAEDSDVSDSQAEETDPEKEESENSDEDEIDGDDVWREILRDSYVRSELGERLERAEDVLKEPFLSELVDVMQAIVQNRLRLANYLQDDDKLYQKIDRRILHYIKGGFADDEAAQTGWMDCRYLIRKEIGKHLDALEEDNTDDDVDASDSENENEDILLQSVE